MIYRFTILLMAFLLLSCEDDKNKKPNLPSSSGNINNLSVVADNMVWQESVGEKIRDVLAGPIEWLPIPEPLFTIRQMPPQAFSDFTTRNRTILIVKKDEKSGVAIKRNVYAKPQTVVLVTGSTSTDIINEIEENKEKIISAFKNEEYKEKQRRIKKSLFNTEKIEADLGVSLRFPTAYRIAKDDDGFFWVRKDINKGTMDLMIYDVPLNTIRKGDSAVVDIVKMRDSIGEQHIQGRVEGAYMITEKAFAPFRYDDTIDGKPAIVTKGLWDVKNDFMSGPFINYAIEDAENNRLVIVEGYVFAPSVDKRDSVFELESIIQTVEID